MLDGENRARGAQTEWENRRYQIHYLCVNVRLVKMYSVFPISLTWQNLASQTIKEKKPLKKRV